MTRPAKRRPSSGGPGEATTPVRLAGRVIDLSRLYRPDTATIVLFQQARAETGHAECLCTTPALRLVIRCRNGCWHLARWPGDRDSHDPACHFTGKDPALSGRLLHADAITETDDATSIKLATALTTKSAVGPTRTPRSLTTTASEPTRLRGSITLLGLLHYLWEEADLNRWHPRWRRTWWTCTTRLEHAAAQCEVNGQHLADISWIVPPYRPDTAKTVDEDFAAFALNVGYHRRGKQAGPILGELKDITPTKYGVKLKLRHHRHPVYATDALHARMTRTHPFVFSRAADEAGGRRIALLVVEKGRKGIWKLVTAAFMLTNDTWIPADSSHEITMADALTDAGRTFTKPLRYDQNKQVFPDFVLTDTTPPTIVEVYGITGNETYEARKGAKQRYYGEAGHPVLEWRVGGRMPSLGR